MTPRGPKHVAVNLLFYKVVFLTIVNLPLFIFSVVSILCYVALFPAFILQFSLFYFGAKAPGGPGPPHS